MAVLLHLASGARHHLWMEHLVGRSRRCALRLDDGLVSSKHALLRWVDEQWVLRDLGSRNGTFLESQALRPGEQRALRVGDVIAFGRRDDPWRLDSDDPPVPMATPEDGGAPVFADSELLTLPDCDAPALVVLRDGEGRWIKERGDEVAPAVDQELVAIAGRVWRLHLPTSVDITAAPELVATIDAIAVRFVVSRDEEEVRVVVRWGAREHDLGVYAHHYTLLTLARLRIRDQVERGLPRDAQGWVHADELTRMLRIDDNKLNVDIWRARRHLAQVGVRRAGGLIERRTQRRLLRIGVEQLEVAIV